MRTKLDPDDEFFIPDVSGIDWSKAGVGPNPPKPGEKTEICIDGAVGYQLRLIPSNKILARFESTLEAWPAIIAAVEVGPFPPNAVARLERGRRPALAYGGRTVLDQFCSREQRRAASVREPPARLRPSGRRSLRRRHEHFDHLA